MNHRTISIIRFLVILFLSLNTQFLSAQYEDLQKDKKITWIAEFSNDYSFSLNTAEGDQKIKMIKFNGDASDFSDANTSKWVISWIFNNAKNGHSECYKDEGLTQSLSNKDLNDLITSVDTVITFDPDTYQEMIQVVTAGISLQEIQGLRVNQVIYYDKKSKNFNTRVISVAPLLFVEKGSNAKTIKKEKAVYPLFWIKMDGALPRKFKVKSSDISWAALVFSKTNPVDLNSIKTVKTNYGFDVKTQLRQQAVKFEKPITRTYDKKEELKIEDLNSMYMIVDTVITFNPDTYEEMVQITRSELKPDEVSNIRLVQEWYFDKKRKRLMNRLKAISPTLKMEGKKRGFFYWKTMYFIKYN